MTSTAAKITERQEFLSNIITTAVEGGSNYWALFLEYDFSMEDEYVTTVKVVDHVENDDFPIESNFLTGRIENWDEISAAVEDGTLPSKKITPIEIYWAIKQIIEDDLVNSSYSVAIYTANKMNDAGEIDADIADVIMQVAVLGDVVYG